MLDGCWSRSKIQCFLTRTYGHDGLRGVIGKSPQTSDQAPFAAALCLCGFLQSEPAPFLCHRHECPANALILRFSCPPSATLGQTPALTLHRMKAVRSVLRHGLHSTHLIGLAQ